PHGSPVRFADVLPMQPLPLHMTLPPPSSTLFPYTTLFRSVLEALHVPDVGEDLDPGQLTDLLQALVGHIGTVIVDPPVPDRLAVPLSQRLGRLRAAIQGLDRLACLGQLGGHPRRVPGVQNPGDLRVEVSPRLTVCHRRLDQVVDLAHQRGERWVASVTPAMVGAVPGSAARITHHPLPSARTGARQARPGPGRSWSCSPAWPSRFSLPGATRRSLRRP